MSQPTKTQTKPLQIVAPLHRLLKLRSADESRPMADIAQEKLWELFPEEHAAFLAAQKTLETAAV